ncbi:Putative ketoacyl reductase [Marinovum algicola]|uniref:3-oxoacyl-[acyl-carrier protein] reductase n=1 Tax=Marinovum algicola TaxID=42444 RepID=A0A975WEV0_9RHOB|nr:SDR family oxidoreductase [Marinovum algicola]SEK09063.1 3-oxoacyl-[acyl-carrier protein] reductase [Marinovum algicola]SLN71720.1 Putative ketoacyl reductase [Marinovum algicola]
MTGGNRGIGLAIALGFASEGARVAICGRDREALASAGRAIEECGGTSWTVEADLFTADGCEHAIASVEERFGALDVLVNNASTNVGGRLEELTDEKLVERFMGKTLASMRLARAALPHLRRSGRGRVICIGGTSARVAHREALPQGLGNSALANFAKNFSADVAPDGITVNVVHPPFTKSDRYPARLEARAKERGISMEEAEASFIADFPIGRLVEPADIAPMVLFLASAHASAVTGQTIAVDGGSSPVVVY